MQIRRNAFMRLRFTSPPQLDLLLEGDTVEIRDHDALRAIVHAEHPVEPKALEESIRASSGSTTRRYAGLIDELVQTRVLVPATYRHPLQDAAEHWQQRGWLEALILHLKSRDLVYADFGDQEFCAAPRQSEPVDLDSPPLPADVVPLPAGDNRWLDKLDLLEVMHARRSGAPWTRSTVDASLLSSLLVAGTQEARRNRKAAGASVNPRLVYDCSSYSALETYVVCLRVESIPPGLYRYALTPNALVPLRMGDLQQDLVELCIGQARVKGCAFAILIGARWERYYERYRHARAYRNLLINTAELAHTYILAATAAGLSNFITPAFRDDVGERLLGVPALEVAPLYLVAVG